MRENEKKDRMQIPIIYEDEFLLVVDKPSGVVVNRAESVKEETLQDWVESKFSIREPSGRFQFSNEEIDFAKRSGIVHRLDKETSGLLIIAKTPQIFLDLQAQFAERVVTKKYITLVHGKVLPAEGEIRASVGRLPWNRERFGILPGGREAMTSYKLLKSLNSPKGEPLSLLEVTPHTGRTHQIRIHLKYLGHPVVSDKFYAGRKTAKADREFCSRLFLHAAYVAFIHPKLAKTIEFTSEMPQDLQKALAKVTKNV